MPCHAIARLDWIGSAWIGLDRIGLDWLGSFTIVLDRARSDWTGLDHSQQPINPSINRAIN
eukprot:5469501-Lingulodinium_polyedra.AAC.1